MMDLKLVLTEAREKVSQGWFRVNDIGPVFTCGNGEHCVLTSVSDAIVETEKALPTGLSYHVRMAIAMQALGFDGEDDAIRWNDAKGRTHREVLERFDEAVEKVC